VSSVAPLESRLESALRKVATQDDRIAELEQTRSVDSVKEKHLAQGNTAIRDDLNIVVTSTSVLSQTLNVGHLVGVAPLPEPSGMKRSG
jgi:hypothetical protein